MPAEIFGPGYEFLPKAEILRFLEIESIARVLVNFGVRKLRITGGEPLLRKDLPVLIEMLTRIEGVEDIAMTTNAVLLARHAEALKKSGLERVTVSLDALDADVFGQMNGVGAKPDKVIAGIDQALAVGLGVKVNAVIKKGVNENQIIPLVKFAQSRKLPIRFIEYMDTGNTNQWKLDEVMSSETIRELLSKEMNLVKLPPTQVGETAIRYGVKEDTGFEVGFISSVTKPFCADCNRMRLSANGLLYGCLFSADGLNVKDTLREGSEEELKKMIEAFWRRREDRYSVLRASGVSQEKPEMSYIGG